ncbi:MAG: 4-alpha-glucanotransferase [Promethearchaeota archaeon]
MPAHTVTENPFGANRYGGILLHPTSLPGDYGIGDLGPNLYRFIDFLHVSGQQLWQILPLGPTGYGNSPYQCFSSFAGNPMLISPEKLQEIGILEEFDSPRFPESRVDFGKIIPFKWEFLERAFENYSGKRSPPLQERFDAFTKQQQFWLEDYALFMSIKKAFNLQAWNTWDEPLRLRDPNTLKKWKADHTAEVEFHKFVQFLFNLQWNDVRAYSQRKNVKIIGDIPIFVAYDSADVWANRELFYLDDEGKLLYVAGVPPDYFSETGQRWGNPLYRWDVMKAQEYNWWIQRVKYSFMQVDILRIDHFRGFEAYWQIPADQPTAIIGDWVPGPGIDLFIALRKALGHLPIIAENLGVITPAVDNLLQQTGFPGMRVLQFAFGGDDSQFTENRFLPHNYVYNTIVYTGTHDNNTTKGWFETVPETTQNKVLKYVNSNGEDIVGDLIRLAWSSVAQMSVIPLQDLLRLGKEGRMNFPGTESGNWEWRFKWEQLRDEKSNEFAELSKIYGRILSKGK